MRAAGARALFGEWHLLSVSGLSAQAVCVYLFGMRTTLLSTTPHASAHRTWLLAGAAALLIGVLTPVYRLQQISWAEAVAAAITFVVPGIVLGRVVWRLLISLPKSYELPRTVAMHAVAAVAFSIAWTIPLIALVYLLRGVTSPGFQSGGMVWQLVLGLVIYCALLLAARIHKRLREQELATANAELQALRSQLDPHFLFNTLHSLTQLAREDPLATQDALERFGELMRYVLKSGRRVGADVALEQELEFVRNYLALEKLRLGDRLQVVEQIDADAFELAVPPLSLQPLVENAVRHGLSPRRQGGTLRLVASVLDDRLVILVSDNGNGVDAARMSESKGLGLKAVARLLEAHFRTRVEFSIHSRPGDGFMVKLSMPARLPPPMPSC
jgi:anti-sigma regulatory factor (Ser/Thr protein kinase)